LGVEGLGFRVLLEPPGVGRFGNLREDIRDIAHDTALLPGTLHLAEEHDRALAQPAITRVGGKGAEVGGWGSGLRVES